MSASISPSRDLILNAKVPVSESLFTTFDAKHFVKPSQFVQPVKAIASQPVSFAGCFTEVFAAAALDLDYDEPNAVVEAELELLSPGSRVHQIELPANRGAGNCAASASESERSAA